MRTHLFLLFWLGSIATYAQKQPFASVSVNENPSEWILIFDDLGLMGYINSEGKEIVPPIYEAIHPFGEYKENWARVETLDGLTGFIDNTGKVVVEPKYEYIEKFGEYKQDWALVSVHQKYGFIDLKGKEIVAPIYSEIPMSKRK